jgi:hypothetical protein
LSDEVRIEHSAIEIAFDDGRWEVRVIDELGVDGVAAEVSFGSGEEVSGGEFAGDEAEVEVTFADGVNFFAADVTEVTLFAAGHGESA